MTVAGRGNFFFFLPEYPGDIYGGAASKILPAIKTPPACRAQRRQVRARPLAASVQSDRIKNFIIEKKKRNGFLF
jgi:hypothetical protein